MLSSYRLQKDVKLICIRKSQKGKRKGTLSTCRGVLSRNIYFQYTTRASNKCAPLVDCTPYESPALLDEVPPVARLVTRYDKGDREIQNNCNSRKRKGMHNNLSGFSDCADPTMSPTDLCLVLPHALPALYRMFPMRCLQPQASRLVSVHAEDSHYVRRCTNFYFTRVVWVCGNGTNTTVGMVADTMVVRPGSTPSLSSTSGISVLRQLLA